MAGATPNAATALPRVKYQVITRTLGVAFIAAGALIITREAIGWLRFGYWVVTPLSTFWSWVWGSPEIANLWLLQQPLTLVLFGLGVTGALSARLHLVDAATRRNGKLS
jgi:hypothetical protein